MAADEVLQRPCRSWRESGRGVLVDLTGEFSHRFGQEALTLAEFVKPFTSTPTTNRQTNGALERA